LAQFEIGSEIQDGIPVLRVTGYYEKPAGQQVNQEAERHCRAGRIILVLDLSGCDILSSPGVSTIVELAVDVTDGYCGRLIICGLDKLKEKVLSLVGIRSMAEVTENLPAAIEVARRLKGV
jgi:anti-anti-sigma regulatory factor